MAAQPKMTLNSEDLIHTVAPSSQAIKPSSNTPKGENSTPPSPCGGGVASEESWLHTSPEDALRMDTFNLWARRTGFK